MNTVTVPYTLTLKKLMLFNICLPQRINYTKYLKSTLIPSHIGIITIHIGESVQILLTVIEKRMPKVVIIKCIRILEDEIKSIS